MLVRPEKVMPGFRFLRLPTQPLQTRYYPGKIDKLSARLGLEKAGDFLSSQEFRDGALTNIFRSSEENTRALVTTLRRITGREDVVTEDVSYLRTGLLQQGHKAHILLVEARVHKKNYYFVTYLSRGAQGENSPDGEKLAQEAIQDGQNLSELSSAFAMHLTAQAQQKYHVIVPIAHGTAVINGEEYPFFTLPFVGEGELHVAQERNGNPYMRYAVGYTRAMTRESRREQELAFYRREDRTWDAARDEVLTMLSLIYLLKKRIPREFSVNAGDIMTEIRERTLADLSLITVRGGYTPEISPQEFARVLRNHSENIWDATSGKKMRELQLFGDMTEEQIISHLQTVAQTLLTPQAQASTHLAVAA